MKKNFVALIFGMSLFGCQDPMPENKNFDDQKAVKVQPESPFRLSAPAVVSFQEGKANQFTIQAFASSGSPRVTVEGLPKGAAFDPVTLHFSWTPAFDAANDPANPFTVARTYPLRLTLSDPVSPAVVLEREVQLLVLDTPRPFQFVNLNPNKDFKEGEQASHLLVISDEDFPNGPFQIFFHSAPAGVQATKMDGKTFDLRFVPDFQTAKRNAQNPNKSFELFPVSVSVINPRGRKLDTVLNWKVFDVRNNPLVAVPTQASGGPVVSFPISAEDLNGEIVPRIQVTSPPAYGRFQFKDVLTTPGSSHPAIAKVVTWDQIPESYNGKSENIAFQVCVAMSFSDFRLCKTHTVRVDIGFDATPLPQIVRTSWPLAEIKRAQVGRTLSVPLPVQDLSGSKLPLTVSIEPAELRSQIQWSGGNLRITPTQVGIKHFYVVAKDGYGKAAKESFVVDVLTQTWSDTLILGVGLDDPATLKNLHLYPGARLINPAIDTLTDRDLALRRNVVIGTEIRESLEEVLKNREEQ